MILIIYDLLSNRQIQRIRNLKYFMIVIINIFKFQYLAMKKKLIKISCGCTHTQTDVSETLYNIICFAIAKYHIASMQ